MPGKILIVDEVATNRIVMRVKLAAAFFDTVQTGTGAEALALLDRPGQADLSLIIASTRLPDMDGKALVRRIRAQGRSLPILLLAADDDPETRIAMLAAGASEILTRPLDETFLIARIRSLIRTGNSLAELRLQENSCQTLGLAEPTLGFVRPSDLAVIADCPARARELTDLLRRAPQHRARGMTLSQFLRAPDTERLPDIAVFGLTGRHDDSSLQAIASLRAQPETRDLPVLALLPHPDHQLATQVLERGADDLICGTPHQDEVTLRLDRLVAQKRHVDKLHQTLRNGLQAAVTDPLTGLHNRRFALPRLAQMIDTSRRHARHLAVMIIDIDHFKRINDQYGHGVGDEVLIEVAHRLRETAGPEALAARIGGEEFLIASHASDSAEIKHLACQLCQSIATRPFQPRGSAFMLTITVSIGLSTLPPGVPGPLPTEILEQADRALYRAKTHGRNQVTTASSAA